ncbi:MAG: hypothetical protein V7776_18645 [Halopseudomonas aestusnigri]
MRLFGSLIGIVFFSSYLCLSELTQAQVVCPKSVATVRDSVLAEANKAILQSVYKDLGCDILLDELPGRRGIASFNNHIVDGEMYRLEVAEPRYTREFVRSEVPLFQHSGSLWLHPDQALRENLPTGYTLGIVWHEQYMKGRRGRIFNTVEEIFNSYNNREIGSFVSSDFSVLNRISNGGFDVVPDQGEGIMSAPLYHYLGAEYSPFMKLFSDHLRKYSPFAHMEPKMAAGKNKSE